MSYFIESNVHTTLLHNDLLTEMTLYYVNVHSVKESNKHLQIGYTSQV